MALPGSGAITLSDIQTESGGSSLVGASNAAGFVLPTAMTEFYGWSSFPSELVLLDYWSNTLLPGYSSSNLTLNSSGNRYFTGSHTIPSWLTGTGFLLSWNLATLGWTPNDLERFRQIEIKGAFVYSASPNSPNTRAEVKTYYLNDERFFTSNSENIYYESSSSRTDTTSFDASGHTAQYGHNWKDNLYISIGIKKSGYTSSVDMTTRLYGVRLFDPV